MEKAPSGADVSGMTRMSLLLLERKIDELATRPVSKPARVTRAALRRRRLRRPVSRTA
jgi:hypothetical protein